MTKAADGFLWLFDPEHGARDRLIARWLFLRALGLIYFSAFYALLFQVKGLIGTGGILPASQYLQDVRDNFAGLHRLWFAPTLLWFSSGNHMLMALMWAGLVAAVLLTLNVLPRAMLAVCFVCYLSFVAAAQDFSGYQSDGMLLEAGFISLFLAPPGLWPGWGAKRPPARVAILLLLWEWFRIYFESGVVKLLSGDKTWRNLTAMYEYYQNGPLPTWIGWYVQHFPHWFQKATAGATLLMELVLVWMAFLPRPWRIACFWIVTVWQIGVIATANYTFLNYLVLVLAFLLLDDRMLRRFVPARWWPGVVAEDTEEKRERRESGDGAGEANSKEPSLTPAAKAGQHPSAMYGTGKPVPLSTAGGVAEEGDEKARSHLAGAKAPPISMGLSAGTDVLAYQKPPFPATSNADPHPPAVYGTGESEPLSAAGGVAPVGALTAEEGRREMAPWVRRLARVGGLAVRALFLTWVFYVTTVEMVAMFLPVAGFLEAPVVALEPFRVANQYGLFAVMTPHRYEIEFQGSNDDVNWVAYPFRYKPQDVHTAPGIYAPYQPRFDWNLWFASLGSWMQNPMVPRTEELLLENDKDVLHLFAGNPFPNAPPKYVRAVIWQYWFSTPEEKREQGIWWTRQYLGTYAPTITRLADGQFGVVAGASRVGPPDE